MQINYEYILGEGTIYEKRELLGCLKSRLVLKIKLFRWKSKNKKITEENSVVFFKKSFLDLS